MTECWSYLLGNTCHPYQSKVLCPLLLEGKQFGLWGTVERWLVPECIIYKAQGAWSPAFSFLIVFLPLGSPLKDVSWDSFCGILCVCVCVGKGGL